MDTLVYIRKNDTLNGIEIKFSGEPVTAPIGKAMKEAGYKWSPNKKHFYQKVTEKNHKNITEKTKNTLYELQQRRLIDIHDGVLSELQDRNGTEGDTKGLVVETLQKSRRDLPSNDTGGQIGTRGVVGIAQGTDTQVAIREGIEEAGTTDTHTPETENIAALDTNSGADDDSKEHQTIDAAQQQKTENTTHNTDKALLEQNSPINTHPLNRNGAHMQDTSTVSEVIDNEDVDNAGEYANSRTETAEVSATDNPDFLIETAQPAAYDFHKMLKQSTSGNFILPDDAFPLSFTEIKAMDDNIAALELLNTLLKEKRAATLDEQGVLSHWRGWGGLKKMLAEVTGYSYMQNQSEEKRKRTKKARELMEEFDILSKTNASDEIKKQKGSVQAAELSILNAHYTHPQIVKAIWQIIQKTCFTGGRVLEPSAGIGTFLGMMPENMRENSQLFAVEKDIITGYIASFLYPKAHTSIMGLEEARLPQNYFDLIVSNIPFGKIPVFDQAFAANKELSKFQTPIHQYFFVKAIQLAAEGGIIAFITSKGCLESSQADSFRQYINQKCNFLGAIRFPAQAQKTIANTEVTTDLILLQKKGDGVIELPQPDFLTFKEIELPLLEADRKEKLSANAYYIDRPHQIIGKNKLKNLYGAIPEDGASASMIYVDYEKGGTDYEKIMGIASDAVVAAENFITAPVFNKTQNTEYIESIVYSGEDDDFVGIGNIVETDGRFFIIKDRLYKTWQNVPFPENRAGAKKQPVLSDKEKAALSDYLRIRLALKKTYHSEVNGKERLTNLHREELGYMYDSFVKAHGFLHEAKNRNVILYDQDAAMVLAIEVADGKTWRKAAVFTESTLRAITVKTAKNIDDAIAIVLNEAGPSNMSMARIAALLGISQEEAIQQAKGKIFKMPDGSFQHEIYYGSGNIVKKIKEVETLAAVDNSFNENVTFLQSRRPRKKHFTEISAQIGSDIIPHEAYTRFADLVYGYGNIDIERKQTLKAKESSINSNNKADTRLNYVAYTYSVTIINERAAKDRKFAAKYTKYGTEEIIRPSHKIYEAALNNEVLLYSDTVNIDGKEYKVPNAEKTAALNAAVSNLKDTFASFLEKDAQADIRGKIEDYYNENINVLAQTKYDGSFLKFPGYAPKPGFDIHPHVKNATWMVMSQNGCVVDHTVGAGKTSTMIFSIMKMKQAGIIKKPVMALLKSTIPDITKEFREYYPGAKILAPAPTDFSEKNRKELFGRIASENWDCIILSHEQLLLLPVDPSVEEDILLAEVEKIEAYTDDLQGQDRGKGQTQKLKDFVAKRESMASKLKQLAAGVKEGGLTLNDLGIDHIMVDESHKFKNLQYFTEHGDVAGLGPALGSSRAFRLYILARSINKIYQADKGITFLSGTPLTNSLVEMFTIFRFIMPSTLAEMQIDTFDKWAGVFAVKSEEVEFDVSGALKQKIRFRKFVNVQELSALYTSIADVRTAKSLPDLRKQRPAMRGGEMQLINVPISCQQQQIMADVAAYMAIKGRGQEHISTAENLVGNWTNARGMKILLAKGLLATNIAQKAAIDVRLLNSGYTKDYGNKIGVLCKMLAAIYYQSNAQKGVQIVFCDIGVPKENASFTVYAEVKQQLAGIYKVEPRHVQFIHDYTSDKQKLALYRAINDGEVRILLGSTEKAGTGLNIQKRIVALHHMDLRWTPAALEQRNGRGIRKGNLFQMANPAWTLPIFVYATEKTLDAYKFELLKLKQTFIEQIRDGSITASEMDEGDASSEDGENASLSYAAFVSIVSGNTDIKEEAKLKKAIASLEAKRKAHMNTLFEAQKIIKAEQDFVSLKNTEIESAEGHKSKMEQYKKTIEENIEIGELVVSYIDLLTNAPIKYTYRNATFSTYIKFLKETLEPHIKEYLKDRPYADKIMPLEVEFGNFGQIKPNIDIYSHSNKEDKVSAEKDNLFTNKKQGNGEDEERAKRNINIRYYDKMYAGYITIYGSSKETIQNDIVGRLNKNINEDNKIIVDCKKAIKSYTELVKNAKEVEGRPFLYESELLEKRQKYEEVKESISQATGTVTIASGECRGVLNLEDIDEDEVIDNPKSVYDLGELPDISRIEEEIAAKFAISDIEAEDEEEDDEEVDEDDEEAEADTQATAEKQSEVPAAAPKKDGVADKEKQSGQTKTRKSKSKEVPKPKTQIEILEQKIRGIELALTVLRGEQKTRAEYRLQLFKEALDLEKMLL